MCDAGFPLWRFACLSLAFDDSASAAEIRDRAPTDLQTELLKEQVSNGLERPASAASERYLGAVGFEAAQIGASVFWEIVGIHHPVRVVRRFVENITGKAHASQIRRSTRVPEEFRKGSKMRRFGTVAERFAWRCHSYPRSG